MKQRNSAGYLTLEERNDDRPIQVLLSPAARGYPASRNRSPHEETVYCPGPALNRYPGSVNPDTASNTPR